MEQKFSPDLSLTSGTMPEVVQLAAFQEQEETRKERDLLIARVESYLGQARISPGDECFALFRHALPMLSADFSPEIQALGQKAISRSIETIRKNNNPRVYILAIWNWSEECTKTCRNFDINPARQPLARQMLLDVPLEGIETLCLGERTVCDDDAELIKGGLEIIDRSTEFLASPEKADVRQEVLSKLERSFPLERLPRFPNDPMSENYALAADLAWKLGDIDFAKQIYGVLFRQGLVYLQERFEIDISSPSKIAIAFFPGKDSFHREEIRQLLGAVAARAVEASILGAITPQQIDEFEEVLVDHARPAIEDHLEDITIADYSYSKKRLGIIGRVLEPTIGALLDSLFGLKPLSKETVLEATQSDLLYTEIPGTTHKTSSTIEALIKQLRSPGVSVSKGPAAERAKIPQRPKSRSQFQEAYDQDALDYARERRYGTLMPPIDLSDNPNPLRPSRIYDEFSGTAESALAAVRNRDSLLVEKALAELNRSSPDPLSCVLPVDSTAVSREDTSLRRERSRQAMEQEMLAQDSSRLLFSKPEVRLRYSLVKLMCLDKFAHTTRERMDAEFYFDPEIMADADDLFDHLLLKYPERFRYLVRVLETNPQLPAIEMKFARATSARVYLDCFHALIPAGETGTYPFFPDRLLRQLFSGLPNPEKAIFLEIIPAAQIGRIPPDSQLAAKMAEFALLETDKIEPASTIHAEALSQFLIAHRKTFGNQPRYVALIEQLARDRLNLLLAFRTTK